MFFRWSLPFFSYFFGDGGFSGVCCLHIELFCLHDIAHSSVRPEFSSYDLVPCINCVVTEAIGRMGGWMDANGGSGLDTVGRGRIDGWMNGWMNRLATD